METRAKSTPADTAGFFINSGMPIVTQCDIGLTLSWQAFTIREPFFASLVLSLVQLEVTPFLGCESGLKPFSRSLKPTHLQSPTCPSDPSPYKLVGKWARIS